MSAPGWLRWAFAVAMIAVALYHLARLVMSRVVRRTTAVDVELSHAAMGAVMAMMLVGTLAGPDGRLLALIFGAPTLWFVPASKVELGAYRLSQPHQRNKIGAGPAREWLRAVSDTAGRMGL
jgi:hypothetical protein